MLVIVAAVILYNVVASEDIQISNTNYFSEKINSDFA
jgi:hypothetical protein